MEEFPEGPLLPLYKNPDLLELAQHDELLRNRLDGMRIASETIDENPDAQHDTFNSLLSDMEVEVRGHIADRGYLWDEAYAETSEQDSP